MKITLLIAILFLAGLALAACREVPPPLLTPIEAGGVEEAVPIYLAACGDDPPSPLTPIEAEVVEEVEPIYCEVEEATRYEDGEPTYYEKEEAPYCDVDVPTYEPTLPQAELESIFTIEQLEQAMYPQWNLGEPDMLGHHIISIQRVERESDYIWFEPAGEYVDASDAARYRMEVRHRNFRWESREPGDEQSPLVVEDYYVISIMYNHFLTVDGEPVLLFVVC